MLILSNKFTFTATGDSFISRRLPDRPYEGFKEITDILNKNEFRFTNFEMTTPDDFETPSAMSGGTWANANPEVIKDIKRFGFNCVAWANNHTLDFLYEGLRSTKKYLEKEQIINVGVGMHLSEASKPKYVEMQNGRVGLIGVTTTFHDTWKAGEQRKDGPGRPGVNGISHRNVYSISENDMTTLKKISKKTDINAKRNLDVLEGFIEEDTSNYFFGNNEFKVSNNYDTKVIPDSDDIERIIKSIHEAKNRSDYVIVSIHSHEMQSEDKFKPAQFIEEMSKRFIDEGADAIIGHGPHVLRGIEIYKEKPIFYSLGNFIFQNDTVNYLPADFYKDYNLSSDSDTYEAISERSKNDTRGLGVNKYVWESIIVSWEFDNNQVSSIKLYPISLQGNLKNYNRGWPILSRDISVLHHVSDLSKGYGTEIKIKEDYAEIVIMRK